MSTSWQVVRETVCPRMQYEVEEYGRGNGAGVPLGKTRKKLLEKEIVC